MRVFNFNRFFKNSPPVLGCFGVFFGFILTDVFISLRQAHEIVMSVGDENHSEVSSNAASTIKGKISKIFCMVLSSLGEDGTRAKSVNNTWGKRCDTLIFVTSYKAQNLNTILIPENLHDNRGTLWDKVKFGFSHGYSSYYDHDWFLKADDDTFVVMENLKVFLSGYNTSDPLFFGCRFKKAAFYQNVFTWDANPVGYMSGGAGYVLSKEALRRFVEDALKNRRCYTGISWAEDVNMAVCMEISNVDFMDTRDFSGRLRFFPMMPYDQGFLMPGRLRHNFWYFDRMYYHPNDGTDCCSESAITFHYAAQHVELIEFFLYHLSPYQH